jgi:hypothetical protein
MAGPPTRHTACQSDARGRHPTRHTTGLRRAPGRALALPRSGRSGCRPRNAHRDRRLRRGAAVPRGSVRQHVQGRCRRPGARPCAPPRPRVGGRPRARRDHARRLSAGAAARRAQGRAGRSAPTAQIGPGDEILSRAPAPMAC